MEKQFDKILEETSNIIDKLEDKIENVKDDFSEDTSELWTEVKKTWKRSVQTLKPQPVI